MAKRKLTKAQATGLLHDVSCQFGEAFVVEWLEQRLGGGDVPKNKPDEPFKVGDTVCILHGLTDTSKLFVVPKMRVYEGERTCIDKVADDGTCEVRIDGNTYGWAPEWLEKVEE